MFLLLLACSAPSDGKGVYRAGPNAVIRGARSGTVKVWGPDGTVDRIASRSGRDTLIGQAGPMWITDRDIPAPVKSTTVSAALLESIAFRVKPLFGEGTVGVWVRSAVKVRQQHAPPIYLVAAVRDDHGAGKLGAAPVVRQGPDCEARIAIVDAKAEAVVTSVPLPSATQTCTVPGIVPPVDRDGDGGVDFLVYGQDGTRGFRAWFSVEAGPTLVAGPYDVWTEIPA